MKSSTHTLRKMNVKIVAVLAIGVFAGVASAAPVKVKPKPTLPTLHTNQDRVVEWWSTVGFELFRLSSHTNQDGYGGDGDGESALGDPFKPRREHVPGLLGGLEGPALNAGPIIATPLSDLPASGSGIDFGAVGSVPAPSVISVLVLAGFSGRRRRRH